MFFLNGLLHGYCAGIFGWILCVVVDCLMDIVAQPVHNHIIDN